MTTAWRCATAWKDHSPCNWRASARLCAGGRPELPGLRGQTSHEVSFERARFSQLRTDKPYDVPLVCATPSGARITRSRRPIWRVTLAPRCGARGQRCASNWLALPPAAAAGVCVGCRAAHGVACGDAGGPGGRADRVAPHRQPQPRAATGRVWRLQMAVKPGKAAWDWWSGPLAGMKPDMATYRRFIDFAAEAGLPYPDRRQLGLGQQLQRRLGRQARD